MGRRDLRRPSPSTPTSVNASSLDNGGISASVRAIVSADAGVSSDSLMGLVKQLIKIKRMYAPMATIHRDHQRQ